MPQLQNANTKCSTAGHLSSRQPRAHGHNTEILFLRFVVYWGQALDSSLF